MPSHLLRPSLAPARVHRVSVTAYGAATLAALALALSVGCSGGAGDGHGTAAAETSPGAGGAALRKEAAPKVLVTPLVQREMVRRISTTTVVESEREIQLFPRIAGQVIELSVEEGDRVVQGQVLALLDPRQAEAARDQALIAKREAEDAKRRLELAIQEAEAREARARLTLEQAERELERKEGIAQGLLSKNELEQLRLTRDQNASDLEAQRTAVASARAQLVSQDIAIDRAALQVETAELDLSFTRISAPFDGVVAERRIKVGDLVSTGAAILTLTDPDHVRAIVYRPQRELAFFRAAERSADGVGGVWIEAVPEALPDERYVGHIRIVSPTVDASSGQFRVTVGLDQPEAGERPRLLPGMLLRLDIVTERHPDALVVPKRAVVREGEAYFVFTAVDGVARRVRVREAFTDDLDVEVQPEDAEALEPGVAIVVVGNRDLEDGDRVEAADWARPGAAPATPEAEGAEAETTHEAALDEEAPAGDEPARAAESAQEATPPPTDDGTANETAEATDGGR